jgi:glycosyltransferase involved in cell wall biosynthesis
MKTLHQQNIISSLANVHVAVVVPCYKVERSIESVVAGIPEYIKSIVLVNDSSPGETGQILNQLEQAAPGRVYAVHLPQNRGVGGATLAGWEKAVELGAEIVVKLDGDGQMDPDYLPELLEPLLFGDADYSKGNRFTSSEVLKKMPKVRLIGNAGLSFLNRLASGYWKTLDPTNGYLAIRAELIPQLLKKKISPRYFFESSLLIELGLLRAVVRDIPMRAIYGEEQSNLSAKKALFEFPPKLFAGFLRRIFYNKFLFDTSPDLLLGGVGLPLLLFGIIWGIVKYIQFAMLGVPATAGTVMIAALPSILGFQMCLTAIQIDFLSVPSIPLTRPIDK